MSNYVVSDTTLTSVANAIRTKGGTSAQLEWPDEFISAIGAISGGSDTLTDLLNNTMTTLEYNGTASIPQDFAKDKTSLTSVSMPNVTTIGANAFNGCINVATYNFSNLTTLGAFGFYKFGAGVLTTMHLSKLTTGETNYNFGYMGTSAKPVTLVLPSVVSLGTDAFRGGYFDAVDIGPNLAEFNNRTFYSMGKMDAIILRKADGLVTLTNTNSISSLTSATTIYIPKALYDHLGDGSASDYKAATNWTTKATTVTWACIEGSQYETAYADGTTIMGVSA